MSINNSFINTLTQHREGGAIEDLSAALAEVSEAALLTGRAGKIKISLTIKPAGGKSRVAVVIEDDISTTLPKAEKVNSIFFFHEGALLRDNPAQLQMKLTAVAGGIQEEAPAKAAVINSK